MYIQVTDCEYFLIFLKKWIFLDENGTIFIVLKVKETKYG